MVKGILFLGISIILRILPVLLSLQISGVNFRRREERIRGWLLLFCNVVASCLIDTLLGGFHPVAIAKRILFRNFTGQQIVYLPLSVLLCGAVATVLGYLFRKGPVQEVSFFFSPGAVLLNASVITISVILLSYLGLSGEYMLCINEVHSGSEIIYHRIEYRDYVELYNPSPFECELRGLYLSDDPENLTKIRVRDTKMIPRSLMVVEIDSDLMELKEDGGQTLYLASGDGRILDQVDARKVDPGRSYGRMGEDGIWTGMAPTPGDENRAGEENKEPIVAEDLSSPVFSSPAGFYRKPFYLTLSAGKGCRIFYTLDASLPTPDSTEYTTGIYVYDRSEEENLFLADIHSVPDYREEEHLYDKVNKAFIVRAIAVNAEGMVSRPVSATYFIDKEQYRSYPVVSLMADPEELYGEDGIYVTGKAYDEWYLGGQEGEAPLPNYLGKGKGYEIPANVEIIRGDTVYSQEVGLRITGGSNRNSKIKRFRIYARREYSGLDVFDFQIAEGINSHRLGTRGSPINAFVMEAAAERDVATQKSWRCNIFVNGEYYCQASLGEHYDEEFFAEHYGVEESNVLIAEESDINPEFATDTEANREWLALCDYVQTHDLTQEDAYTQLCDMIDMQSYLDYLCIRTYIDDTDYNEKKNVCLWKTRRKADGYADTRWRWTLYDLDSMEFADYGRFGYTSEAQKNTFRDVGEYTGGKNSFMQPFFLSLYRNEDFRKRFVTTFMDIANTVFARDHMEEIIEEFGSDLSGYLDTQPIDYYRDFFNTRYDYIVPYLADFYELKGSLEEVEIRGDTDTGGEVKINTAAVPLKDGVWCGSYYTDYPITLSALPAEGYQFAGWDGDVVSSEPVLEIALPAGGIKIHARFEKK